MCSDEEASTTSKLCVKLFKEMGENISIQDIDTAHRVPQRNNAGNPKPIVCRFVRRLVKESLMSHRKEISDVTPAAVGLPEGSSLSSARIYDHLSPRMQAVLFQAKKVKEELHYQYCWSKGPVICLRKDSTSRPSSCFTFSLQLINCPLLDLWYLWLGKLCLDISKKDRNSTKTGLTSQ